MSEPLILTFDVGTQSVRAMLIDKTGCIRERTSHVYARPYYSLHPTWAEQRPDFFYEEMCLVSRELREKAPELFAQAVCMVMTVFRDSTVCLDEDGMPLRDCILWMDQRQAENLRPIPWLRRIMFALVGMTDTVNMLYHTSVCNWIAENEPELWAKTRQYVLLSTYLNFRFTGNIQDSWASMIAKIPFDYRHRRWDKNGLTRCLYDVPADKLCRLVPSGAELGRVTAQAAADSGIPEGLPLIATGSDKGCETIGLSVLEEDQAALSFGTSCTVQFTSRRYFEPHPFMPSYPAVPNDLYNGEIQLLRGYWMLTWFKQNFAQDEVREAARQGCSAEEILNRHLASVPPGCDGLLLLPHWTPGLYTPGARGAMIGFSDGHTKYHIYRAIIEGLNYGLMEGLYTMQRRSGQKIQRLFLGGGGSRSEEICQITADMFGLPVSRIQTNESSALGAAMCAFVSLGEFPSYQQAAGSMVRIRDTFQPRPELTAFYQRIYREVFSRYYRTVLPLHKRLIALTGRPRKSIEET